MYEQVSATAGSTLQTLNPIAFSQNTIDRILALTAALDGAVTFQNVTADSNGHVDVAPGAEVVLIASSDTKETTITAPSKAAVLVFEGKGGVDVTLNDGNAAPSGHVDRIIVGTSGTDHIVVADNLNSQITLGNGRSVVVTGAGNDTVVAGLGNSTVIGGSGHAIVELKGNAADYSVSVQNGHAVVSNDDGHTTTNISKIQFVQLDNGEALIFANDAAEASVSTLYEAAFGRDADGGGINYWFEASKSGASLTSIAEGFLNSAEYRALAPQTDQQFVDGLYLRTFNRAGDASGLEFWTNALHNGVSRAAVLAEFVHEAGASLDGTAAVIEPVVVGSVTIVHNII